MAISKEATERDRKLYLLGKKLCRCCNNVLELTRFSTNNRYKDKKCSYCKDCSSKKHAASWAKNKEHVRARGRKWHDTPQGKDSYYSIKYGMTYAEYVDLVRAVGHRCQICSTSVSEKRKSKNKACVDHDHSTGKVRGILCSMCNRGIGCLQDNVELLSNAVTYLETHNNAGD